MKDTTLKILSKFELKLGLVGFDWEGSNGFQLFEEQQTITYTEFTLLSGFYDADFTRTPQ